MGATNTLLLCVNSQARIDNILSDAANPVNQTKATLGTLAALNSPINTQGWDALPIRIPGRARPSSTSNRKVSLAGRVKGCPTVLTSAIDPCAGVTASTTDLVDTEVQINSYHGVSITLDRTVYQDTCDSPNGEAASVASYKIMEAAQQILEAENTAAVVAMQAAVGDYFDTTNSAIGSGTEKTIPLYSSTAPIIPQPGNMFLILNEYKRKGYSGVKPIIVGGTTLERFAFDTNLYTSNVDGQDISKVRAIAPTFLDYQIDSSAADGNSHLLTWVPGHVQHLTWVDYYEGSPIARSNGEITKTTINIDGEIFDIVTFDSNCDDDLDITLSRWSTPYIIPEATFFSTTCGGEFGLLNWDLDCADTVCANISVPGDIIT